LIEQAGLSIGLGIKAAVAQRALTLLMHLARHPHQPHPIAQVMLQSALDATAQIGLSRLACSAAGAERTRASRATWIRSSLSTSGTSRRAVAVAMASASERCSSTKALRALRAERLREEAGEAIGRTAKNPTPTGRPQHRDKDAT
jgi:hypothetical protein